MSRSIMKAEIDREQARAEEAWEHRNMDAVELTQARDLMSKIEKNHDGQVLSKSAAVELIQAYCAIAQAEAMERIATHLGNIHQALLTPNANGEPVTVADSLKRVADVLESQYELDTNPYR